MKRAARSKSCLDALRPLAADRIVLLWPQWKAEDALFVYTSNAVEGSTLTRGETLAVLKYGITIGGKPWSHHLDAVNEQKAMMMLDLGQKRASITLKTFAIPGVGDPTEFIRYTADLEEHSLERYLKSLEIAYRKNEPDGVSNGS